MHMCNDINASSKYIFLRNQRVIDTHLQKNIMNVAIIRAASEKLYPTVYIIASLYPSSYKIKIELLRHL